MNNKKLVSIIVSKIIVGEITFASLEREVIKQKHEEILKMSSKTFSRLYENFIKWYDVSKLSFESVKCLVNILELIHEKEYDDEKSFIAKLSERTRMKEQYLEKRILDDDRENIYSILNTAINKYCYKQLGVMPNTHWTMISKAERLELLEEIESFLYNYEE
ncbi:MAG: hypothetical protein IJ809_03205 [Clostridia bacterium]|nr:hypothetical protein [Clostridia bacterium]